RFSQSLDLSRENAFVADVIGDRGQDGRICRQRNGGKGAPREILPQQVDELSRHVLTIRGTSTVAAKQKLRAGLKGGSNHPGRPDDLVGALVSSKGDRLRTSGQAISGPRFDSPVTGALACQPGEFVPHDVAGQSIRVGGADIDKRTAPT